MFNGHLDINPIAAGWTRDPFDPWIESNKLYGAGIRNMKSGLASMIHAEDFAYIDEMLLCSQVLALTALDLCT